jgi:FkbM family methyltransferase
MDKKTPLLGFQVSKEWFEPASNRISSSDSIIIYGAGNFGKELCLNALDKEFHVLSFLDQKAVPDQSIFDIPVYLPYSTELSVKQRKDSTVLVAIHNRDVDLVPIIDRLNKLGFGRVLNPVEFFDTFFDHLGNRFWLTSPTSYQDQQEEIINCYSFWKDDSSRLLYSSLLKQRIVGDYSVLPCPDTAHQYFPQNTPPWKYPLRFIDCGAYDGDTLRQMKIENLAVEKVLALEPDLNNFKQLSKYISTEWNSPAMLFPFGVHSTSGQLRFERDGGEGGKINEHGESIIQVVALDDVLHGYHPNLIKMDIEGSEIEGLLGAQDTIKQNNPGLAICVYHSPDHLWKIPMLIQKWDLGYEFYLRNHAYNGFETVMYAIQS